MSELGRGMPIAGLNRVQRKQNSRKLAGGRNDGAFVVDAGLPDRPSGLHPPFIMPSREETMNRTPTSFAAASLLLASLVLTSLAAPAQAAPEVSLARFDCGTPQAPVA